MMDAPPADSPITVTREGSPPKRAMYDWIHSRARRWSRRPAFAVPVSWKVGPESQPCHSSVLLIRRVARVGNAYE